MKYCTRSVTWRFRDSVELIPELAIVARLTIQSPQDLVRNYQSLFKDQVRERFILFWLNSANRMIGFEIVSEGNMPPVMPASFACPVVVEDALLYLSDLSFVLFVRDTKRRRWVLILRCVGFYKLRINRENPILVRGPFPPKKSNELFDVFLVPIGNYERM